MKRLDRGCQSVKKSTVHVPRVVHRSRPFDVQNVEGITVERCY